MVNSPSLIVAVLCLLFTGRALRVQHGKTTIRKISLIAMSLEMAAADLLNQIWNGLSMGILVPNNPTPRRNKLNRVNNRDTWLAGIDLRLFYNFNFRTTKSLGSKTGTF